MKKHDSENNPQDVSSASGVVPAGSFASGAVWDRSYSDDGTPPPWLTRAQWLRLSDEIELGLEALESDFAGFVTTNSRLGKQRRRQAGAK